MKFRTYKDTAIILRSGEVFFVWIDLIQQSENVRDNVVFHPADSCFKTVNEAKAYIALYKALKKERREKKCSLTAYN